MRFAAGFDAAEIAAARGMTASGVRGHLSRVISRLRKGSVTQLAACERRLERAFARYVDGLPVEVDAVRAGRRDRTHPRAASGRGLAERRGQARPGAGRAAGGVGGRPRRPAAIMAIGLALVGARPQREPLPPLRGLVPTGIESSVRGGPATRRPWWTAGAWSGRPVRATCSGSTLDRGGPHVDRPGRRRVRLGGPRCAGPRGGAWLVERTDGRLLDDDGFRRDRRRAVRRLRARRGAGRHPVGNGDRGRRCPPLGRLRVDQDPRLGRGHRARRSRRRRRRARLGRRVDIPGTRSAGLWHYDGTAWRPLSARSVRRSGAASSRRWPASSWRSPRPRTDRCGSSPSGGGTERATARSSASTGPGGPSSVRDGRVRPAQPRGGGPTGRSGSPARATEWRGSTAGRWRGFDSPDDRPDLSPTGILATVGAWRPGGASWRPGPGLYRLRRRPLGAGLAAVQGGPREGQSGTCSSPLPGDEAWVGDSDGGSLAATCEGALGERIGRPPGGDRVRPRAGARRAPVGRDREGRRRPRRRPLDRRRRSLEPGPRVRRRRHRLGRRSRRRGGHPHDPGRRRPVGGRPR